MTCLEQHVIFDPGGRRTRIVSRLGSSLLVVLGITVGGLHFGIIKAPILPKTALIKSVWPAHSDSGPRPAAQGVSHWDASRKRVSSPPKKIKRHGFHDNRGKTSFFSLTKNVERLDVVIAKWLHTAGPSRRMRRNDVARQRMLRNWMAANANGPNLEIL